MRTDVKVGVVAVVVLFLVVVVYFAFIRHSPSPEENNVLPTQQPALTQAPPGSENGAGSIEIPPASQPEMGPGSSTQPEAIGTSEPGAATQTIVLGGGNGPGEIPGPGAGNEGLNSQPQMPPVGGAGENSTLAGQDYTIVKGDTLSGISERVYGSTKYVKDIERANPGLDPRRMSVGKKIHLPEIAGVTPVGTAGELPGGTGEQPATTMTASQTYVVQSGDSLVKIAIKFYHHASLWTLIYHANRAKIGDDPNNIQAGEQLIIPAH
ncbi:MAG TPA: LysM peptidoglycan-binding domain-containing protein [Phycisphaerae bacterium]|nr:LysM peptidoglycan-binding domain-containing protein [Phycisphaerae bacterium]